MEEVASASPESKTPLSAETQPRSQPDTDALSIHLGGRKSTSPDHEAAARLLRGVMGTRLPREMERTLARVMSDKDRFEYQGYVATLKEAQVVLAKAERYGAWAETVLTGMQRSD